MTVVVPGDHDMVSLLGQRDELLRVVENALHADIHVRGNEITISGVPDDVELAENLFTELIALLERGAAITRHDVTHALAMLRPAPGEAAPAERPAEVLTLNIISSRGRTIRPKTLAQKQYVDAIDDNTIVFGIGPAGTGKTYLAMAKAVAALQAKLVNRIILTRPAVEAGENLGFLPGTLYDKIDPYLRPLYDALHDMVDPESIPRLISSGTIEVAPLAYMRGRAQPVDTSVMTPDGYRPIGELAVGDLVTGSDGRPTPVLGVYPQGRRAVYRVTTQDGGSTRTCAEHLWSVRTVDDTSHGRPNRVIQTRDMIGHLRRHGQRRFELPTVKPIEYPARDVPIDPYALGLLLGDGSIRTVTTRVHGQPGGVMVSNPVTVALRELRLAGATSKAKHIPADYLLNTVEARVALLQGLLDTDGGPVRGGSGRSCRIELTTISEGLRDDLIFLVRSLGGVACTRTRRAETLRTGHDALGRPIQGRHDPHVVEIRLPEGIEPFRLTRKKAVYDECGGGRPMRMIDSIEPDGEADCVCIAVGAADSLYVTEDFLVTHNTLNDAFIILDEAQNSTAEQMKMFLTRLGFGSKIVVTGDVTQVDLPGGKQSGLRVVREILDGISDVHFATLTSADVVRHRLVSDIVDAYTRWDATRESGSDGQRGNTGPRRPRR